MRRRRKKKKGGIIGGIGVVGGRGPLRGHQEGELQLVLDGLDDPLIDALASGIGCGLDGLPADAVRSIQLDAESDVVICPCVVFVPRVRYSPVALCSLSHGITVLSSFCAVLYHIAAANASIVKIAQNQALRFVTVAKPAKRGLTMHALPPYD